LAIGRPNYFLFKVYFKAFSYAPEATPIAHQATAKRDVSKTELVLEKSVANAILLCSGTKQSLSVIAPFYVIRSDHLPSIFSALNPGEFFSTKNPCTLLLSDLFLAQTITSAKVELPIHLLAPFSL